MDPGAAERLRFDGQLDLHVGDLMLMSALRFAIVVALVVSLTSCSRLPSVKQEKLSLSLEASVETYRKMIRWGHFDEAVKYIRTNDGSEITPDLDRIARYRVTSFEIGNQLIADNGKEALVVALIDYYELDSGVLHSLRDDQLWWYDKDEKRWYLGSSLPQFGVE